MNQWAADFGNDPDDDYNLIVEILYDEEYVAVIKQSPNGLILKWYPSEIELNIPVDWLMGLFEEAQRRMGNTV